jgi:uncharacterized protein YbjT (DUF2867 family)
MTETVLIIGATGEVGGHLLDALAGAPVRVRAGVRDTARAAHLNQGSVQAVRFDYDDHESIERAVDGADRVFLLTPPPSLLPHELDRAAPVVDAARRSGVRHLVRLSSMWALHSPASAHRVIEQYIEASGVPYTFLRPNIFMQNFSVSQRDMVRGGGIYVAAGAGRVSFVDVRDVAAAAAAMLTSTGHEGKAYTLTGPEALDYGEAAAQLSAAVGKPIAYHALDDAALRDTLAQAGWAAGLIEYVSALYEAVRDGQRALLSSDIHHLVGRPPISFQQYARDYADVWKA